MGTGRERRMNVSIVLAVLIAIPLTGAALFQWFTPSFVDMLFSDDSVDVDCGEFEFERADWLDAGEREREEIAAHLVDCDILDGKSRSEIAQMLGRHGGGPEDRSWSFSAGWTGDALGPGDGQSMIVGFDNNDRVRQASFAYP